ncbi:LANO_0D10000g1_1 [Lachancea nothofagi CBS 11611]|uniref:LANO_0D10000g1_1 n=1 Tax=Lachancea nothofagi CBS 11611 TaxID=1266666 RepID=A0A1G4JJW5_9SACH|nr:LANO_0D10000g1_1 [Lachancea nothofagi CBS 11611]
MVSDRYSVLVNDHEFLGESVLDEKSVLYFREDERLTLKSQNISSAMVQDSLDGLVALGKSKDGFVKHALRRPVWLKILKSRLSIDANNVSESEKGLSEFVTHKDEHQVSLDVKRSFGDIKDDVAKSFLRQALEQTITKVLRRFPQLNYYQGYHDVVAVFVLVFMHTHKADEEAELSDSTSGTPSTDGSDYHETLSSSSISTKLADDSVLFIDSDQLFESVMIFTLLYLRDFMMSSLAFTIDQLVLIPLIVKDKDPRFYRTFQLNEIDPFFALSSVLTLFSHDLRPQSNESLSIVFQIFDLVISSNSMMVPLTVYSNLLLAKKDDLLTRLKDNLDNFENDTDLIHGVIQQEMIVGSSVQLWNEVLETTRIANSSSFPNAKKTVNKYSVLLTASHVPTTIDQALSWLAKETRLNEMRSSLESVNNKAKTPSPAISRWRLIARSAGPNLIKMSLFIGVAAILMKLYLRSLEGHQVYPQIALKSYLDQLKSLKFSGLNQSRRIWLDPLKNLLKNIGRPSRS